MLKGWAFGLTLPDGEKAAACHWYSDRPAIRWRLAQVVAAKKLGDVIEVSSTSEGVTAARWK